MAKEDGTKADGIGDGRFARGASSICKPCGRLATGEPPEWLTEASAWRRAREPDQDRREKTGTNRAGIGDFGGRRIQLVKSKRKTWISRNVVVERLTSVTRRRAIRRTCPLTPLLPRGASAKQGRGATRRVDARPFAGQAQRFGDTQPEDAAEQKT